MMLLFPPRCNGKITYFRYPSLLVAAFATFLLAAPLSARATVLQFTLDTPSLSRTAASLAFDFIGKDRDATHQTDAAAARCRWLIVVPVAALLLAAVRPRHGDESHRSRH